ncbi:MAG: cell division protein FtsW [Chloroflexi bacterium]|nr:MAG: cell division protein FtsW [Chloroflexota bacterium]
MLSVRNNLDFRLSLIVAGLLGVGLPMVFSASHLLAFRDFGDATYFLQRQSLWVLLGVLVMLFLSRVPYRFWQRVSVVLMLLTIAVLLGMLLLSVTHFGARRWLSEGSFQPSEVAKLVTIIYVAHWLASRRAQLQQFTYGLIPFYVIVGGVAALVVTQPDLGTTIVIVAASMAMFFVAGAPLLQLMVSSLALCGAAAGALLLGSPWRMTRILVFMDPLKDKTGDGYQIYQMLLAMGSGGLFGNGFSSLTGTIGYLPASHTDAIFAVLGNDFGIVGCALLLVLFGLLARQGLLIAQHAHDLFGRLLATGITVWLIGQALLNIASTTASIPFTGIPLPFISFGGSALVSALAGVGVLLSIARSARGVRRSAPEVNVHDGPLLRARRMEQPR